MPPKRIDAHHHFWNMNKTDYPWLAPEHGAIYANFHPRDLKPQLKAVGIDQTVLVQSMNYLKIRSPCSLKLKILTGLGQ